MTLKLRDIVEPNDPSQVLVSGSGWYPWAVVIQVEPSLVLVSEEADMRWSATVDPTKFRVIGEADRELWARCMRRIAE